MCQARTCYGATTSRPGPFINNIEVTLQNKKATLRNKIVKLNLMRIKEQVLSTTLIVSAIVFIIGIIIGFWLARNISVPVLALRDAANGVGKEILPKEW